MRRSVIALIVSIVLLSGGLYFLKSEDSNSLLTMKEEQPSTPSQDKTQQPKQTTPESLSNGTPEESTSMKTTATSTRESGDSDSTTPRESNPDTEAPKPLPSYSSDSGNSEGNTPPVKSKEPQKPVKLETPGDVKQGINTCIKGLSPLFYKGLQIEVVGVNVIIQPGHL